MVESLADDMVVVVYLRWAVHDLEMYVCVQSMCIFITTRLHVTIWKDDDDDDLHQYRVYNENDESMYHPNDGCNV